MVLGHFSYRTQIRPNIIKDTQIPDAIITQHRNALETMITGAFDIEHDKTRSFSKISA